MTRPAASYDFGPGDRILALWAGALREVRVIRVNKTGRVRVEVARGLSGSSIKVTLEPWQVRSGSLTKE